MLYPIELLARSFILCEWGGGRAGQVRATPLRDHHTRVAFEAGANFDDNVVSQGRYEAHQALDREAFEFVAQKSRNLRLVYTQRPGGFDLGEFALGDNLIDYEGETQFGSEPFDVSDAKIGEFVPGVLFCLALRSLLPSLSL